jgi:hypothetical protein
MECDGPWYIEFYTPHRSKADWWTYVPNIEFVIALAKGARYGGVGEIIRFRTNQPISAAEMETLSHFDATRLP